MIDIDHPEVRKWTKNSLIISSFWDVWDEEKDNFKILAMKPNKEFSVYRFFRLGNKVHCSVDITANTETDMMMKLFKKI